MAEFTFAPLTPASFLDRSAAVFADRIAVVDGERSFTYREMSDRCRRLTGALAAMGVGHEDRVAALCTNSHGRLDVLVNNAGLGTAVPALRETPEQFREVIDVNLMGAYWMARASWRAWRRRTCMLP